MRISVVIPVFNNAESIRSEVAPFLEYMKSAGYEVEVIIVDDGSEEGKLSELAANEMGAGFIAHNSNRGKGAAVRSGMEQASGEIVLFTDADIPFSYQSVEKCIELIHSGVQMAVGDRTLPASDYFDHMSAARRFASRLFSRLIVLIFGKGFGDTQCGLKGFSKDTGRRLFELSKVNGFAFDVELFRSAKSEKIEITPFPVQIRPKNSQGKSSVRLMKHGSRMFIDLWKIRMRKY